MAKPDDLSPLPSLSSTALISLAASLRSGQLAAGITPMGVENAIGFSSGAVTDRLRGLLSFGMSPGLLPIVVEAILSGRSSASDPSRLFDLVLSGPDIPGVPTADTAAVMHTLIEEASSRVLLCGYAIYNGKKLFSRLADRMRSEGLETLLCLEISRSVQDTSLDGEIVGRFAGRFWRDQWPWEPRPKIYYDPRSLAPRTGARSALHAKCLVVDRKSALISSANFTEAAMERNIEAGVLVRYAPFAERVDDYLAGLIHRGDLIAMP